MPKIAQIEDCVYGKLKNVSTEQWLDMLKTRYDIERGFGLLLDDYVLLEQTDSRYEDGRLIYSERINYNLHLSTIQPSRANAPKENTDAWEDSWVCFDKKTNQFVVHYIHYLPDTKKDLPQVACEADMECSGEDRQAAPEVEVQSPERKPIPQQPTITTTIQTDDGHRQWRKKTLQKLEYLYTNGYNAQEIAVELNCLIDSVYYNLTKLGYTKLFDPSVWTSWHKQEEKKEEAEYKIKDLVSEPGLSEGDPVPDNWGKQWTREEDRELLLSYHRRWKIPTIAKRLKRTNKAICNRLFKLIGLANPFNRNMLSKMEEQKAKARWAEWLKIDASLSQEDEENRRKREGYRILYEARLEQKKQERKEFLKTHTEDGFLRSGSKFRHSIFGDVTVYKDNETVTVLILADGTKKRIIKS